MPNQLLTIEPQNEIKFKVDYAGMFEQGNTTYLKLTNPSNDTVLFKIKTTAPKKYCVRPNSGILEPYARVEIAITPQPVLVDPNEKHKHKFMVQSVIAPEGNTNVDQVWKEISPDQLMDYKLKCVFEVPRGSALNDSGDSAGRPDVIKKRTTTGDDAKQKETVVDNAALAEKNQKADETAPMPSKTNFPKSENVEVDLQKASLEVMLLREEESKLRHENLQLKEELLRLRQMVEGRVQRRHSYGPEKNGQAMMMPMVAVALVVAVLGIVIGKFFM